MALSPRFGFDDILGNETVDFAVLDSNFDLADAAAHPTVDNSFSGLQAHVRTTVGTLVDTYRVTGDTQDRHSIGNDGVLRWGSGALTPDVNLYRQAADILRTDDSLQVSILVQAGAGSGATPSLSFIADPDTGMYSMAANTLGLSAGGAARAAVSASGLTLQSAAAFGWSGSADPSAAADTTLTHGGSGLLINAGGVTRVTVGASGGFNIAAPAPGVTALAVTAGATGSATIAGIASATTNASFGMSMRAGTSSSDYNINCVDMSATFTRFQVRGDGAVLLNATPGSGLAVSALTVVGGTTWAANIMGPNGLLVQGGTSISNTSAAFYNQAASLVGLQVYGSGIVSVNPGALALGASAMQVFGGPGFTTALFQQTTASGQSNGVIVNAGTNSTDFGFVVNNAAVTNNALFVTGSGQVQVNATAGGNKTACTVYGDVGQYGLYVIGANNGNSSFGVEIDGGSSTNDYAMYVWNRARTVTLFNIRGDGQTFGVGFTSLNNAGTAYGVSAPNVANISGSVIAQAHVTYSSINSKTDVAAIESALDTVRAMRGVRYQHVAQHRQANGTHRRVETPAIGVIMEEIAQVVPEVVSRDASGRMQGVDYGKLVPVLIEAVKELYARVERLQPA